MILVSVCWSLNVSADEIKVLEALEKATNLVTDPYTSRAQRQQLSETVLATKTQIKLYRYSGQVQESFLNAAETCFQNMAQYEQCISALAAKDLQTFRSNNCNEQFVQGRERAPGLLEAAYKAFSQK